MTAATLRNALLAGLALTLAVGCAHTPAPRLGIPSSGDDETVVGVQGLQPEDLGTQSLFRVEYEGPAGSGNFRLILKVATAERYRIETKDRFGRGLWRIDAAAGVSRLVDDRARVYCETEGEIRIPELALEALPLAELPAILLDRLPGALEPTGREGELRDRQGRRWTATLSDGEPSAWTFWEGGEPRMWWRLVSPGEAVLSHRAGTQLRWTRVAVEPMAGAFEALELSDDLARIDCESWPGGHESGGASGEN